MPTALAELVSRWASLYSNHAALRTIVIFAHVGALVGAADARSPRIAARCSRRGSTTPNVAPRSKPSPGRTASSSPAWSLIVVSGLLMFAADLDTFLYSRVFWIKMALVGLLLVNGAVLTVGRAPVRAGATQQAWAGLRFTAISSLALWFLITFAGVGLTNVG